MKNLVFLSPCFVLDSGVSEGEVEEEEENDEEEKEENRLGDEEEAGEEGRWRKHR